MFVINGSVSVSRHLLPDPVHVDAGAVPLLLQLRLGPALRVSRLASLELPGVARHGVALGYEEHLVGLLQRQPHQVVVVRPQEDVAVPVQSIF